MTTPFEPTHLKPMNEIQSELLKLKAVVNLDQAVGGFWNGGSKSCFEFSPSIERSPGVPAIRWGSYGANLWFVLPVGKSVKSHLASLRRKLKGNPPRTIEIKPL